MTSDPVARRIPAGVLAVLSADRADRLLSGTRRLVEAMPLAASGPVRAALATLGAASGLGGALLDEQTYRSRGVDLARGAALWALADTSFALLFSATSVRQAIEKVGELGQSKVGRLVHRDEHSALLDEGGAAKLVFGTFPPVVWVMLVGESEEAAVEALKKAWAAPDDERARPLLEALPEQHASLDAYLAEVEAEGGPAPLLISLSLAPRELRLEALTGASPKAREVFQVVCGKTAPDLARSMPRGALALMAGLDLGDVVASTEAPEGETAGKGEGEREGEGEGEPRELSEPAPRGVAAFALHHIDPGAAALIAAGAPLHDLLASGTVHTSLVMKVDDVSRWKDIARAEVLESGGRVEPDGVLLLPVDKASPDRATVRIAFEKGTLVAAMSEDDLREARRAARTAVAGASSDVGDREARALLEKGEPVVYVKVAALLERVEGALVERLWKQGERAGSLGLSQAIKTLKAIDDALLHVQVHDEKVFRAFLKLRLVP